MLLSVLTIVNKEQKRKKKRRFFLVFLIQYLANINYIIVLFSPFTA